MHNFYFRCKACNKTLKHHNKTTKNNEIKEDDLCNECRRIALDGWQIKHYNTFDEDFTEEQTMTDIVLELTTFVVGGVIGWLIGSHNASSAKKQQAELVKKLQDLQKAVEDKITTS